MPVTTLDEIVGMLREGRTPKQVAASLGITERAIQNRFDRAGRLDEYRNVVMASKAEASGKVDVFALMELADRGMSFNSACIELGYPRATATRRLEDERRMGEFYIRSYAARDNVSIPRIDAVEYHEGPRRVILSMAQRLDSEEDRRALIQAVQSVDFLIRDGARLSQMCGGCR